MVGGIRRKHPRRPPRGLHQAAAGRRVVQWRTQAVLALFGIAFGILAYRAVTLMVIPDPQLEQRIARQYESLVVLHPKRGEISDRHGRELAVSVTLDSVFADPALVEDPGAATQQLTPVLGMASEDLLRLLQRDRRFVWLKRQVAPETSEQVRAMGIRGVRTTPEAKRRYPNGDFASQLLGFVGVDGIGLEGLEARYDAILMGEKETYVSLRDGRRRNITPQGVVVKRSTEGQSIQLTIDSQIQFIAQEALARTVEEYSPRGAFVIVMDPHSGDLLAVANAPSFDPNRFTEYGRTTFRNRAVADCFEPGSIMKPFLVAAAMDLGEATPLDEIHCELGSFRIGRNVIHDTHPYAELTVDEILQVSSNIGAAKIAERVGAQRLHESYIRCGFGRDTGVDLTGESTGILRDWKSWRRIGLATHAFGQGISVTGMQLAAALSSVANGGTLYQPRIIREIRDRQGVLLDSREPVVVDRTFGTHAALEARRMMGLVVEEGGTGTRARLDRYTCGGKTGTAQKVNSQTGRYDRTMWVSSFVGFAPLDDPRIVVVVVVDEPQGKHYGGTVAGPVFKEVASRSLRYLGVPPLEEPPALADEAGEASEAGGESPMAEPVAELETSSAEGTRLALSVDDLTDDLDGITAMPDLGGLTLREALARLGDQQVSFQLEGSGLLVEQTPRPGTPVREGDLVQLRFGEGE